MNISVADAAHFRREFLTKSAVQLRGGKGYERKVNKVTWPTDEKIANSLNLLSSEQS